MHLDLDDAVTLTRFASSAFDVEAEASGVVATRARLGNGGKQLAQGREQTRVRGRIGARRPSDRTLVDIDDPVDLLESVNSLARRCIYDGAVESGRRVTEQRIDGQGGLAGAGHSGHAREQPDGNLGCQVA